MKSAAPPGGDPESNPLPRKQTSFGFDFIRLKVVSFQILLFNVHFLTGERPALLPLHSG